MPKEKQMQQAARILHKMSGSFFPEGHLSTARDASKINTKERINASAREEYSIVMASVGESCMTAAVRIAVI